MSQWRRPTCPTDDRSFRGHKFSPRAQVYHVSQPDCYTTAADSLHQQWPTPAALLGPAIPIPQLPWPSVPGVTGKSPPSRPVTNNLPLTDCRFSYPPHYLNKIGCKHYCLGHLLLHNIFKPFEATVYKISALNCPAFVILELPGTVVMQYLLHVRFSHPHIYFTCVCNPLYAETCCYAMEKVYFFHMGCADSVKPPV